MFYTKKQIRGGFFMVPLGGVDIRVFRKFEETDDETGEVYEGVEEFYTLGLEAGQHNGTAIAEVAPQNARFEPIGDNAVAVRVVGNARMQEPTRMTPQQPAKKHVTGANEDYLPRNMEEQKAEAIVRQMKKENDRAEKIQKERRRQKDEERELHLQEKRRQEKEDEAERLDEERRQKLLEVESKPKDGERQAKLAADAAAAGE